MQIRGAPDGACQLCWALPQNLWLPSFVPLSPPLGLLLPTQQFYVAAQEPQPTQLSIMASKACAPCLCWGCGMSRCRAGLTGVSEACGTGAHYPGLPVCVSLDPKSAQGSTTVFVSASFMSRGTPPWPRLIAVSLAWNLFLTPLSQSLNPKA